MPAKKPEVPFGDSRSEEQRLADSRRIVEQAEDEARQMGVTMDSVGSGPEGHMSDQDRLRRNTLIFRSSLRGVDTYDLASIYELHPRTIQEIVKQQRRESHRVSERNPLEVAEELLEQIDAGISEIASVASKETGSVRVTAILGRINALLQKAKWMQSAGILPETAREMKIHIDIDNMGSNLMEILERRGLLTAELAEEIAGTMGRPIETTAVDITDEVTPQPALEAPGEPE
jgi:hypothetical protein